MKTEAIENIFGTHDRINTTINSSFFVSVSTNPAKCVGQLVDTVDPY